MTRQDGPKFSAKHGPDNPIDPIVQEKISVNLKQGQLACAVAFKIAQELELSPAEIGKSADILDLKLNKCQLGLFGYEPDKKKVKAKAPDNPKLEAAIRNSLGDGKLACSDAWEIANRFQLPKMAVSGACEYLNIKIKHCQLGAF